MLFFLLLLNIQSRANTPSINEVRLLYQNAAIEKNNCEKLFTLLKSCQENENVVLLGYKACVTMVMAKYTHNPFKKLSFFNEGKNLLESIISRNQHNIELRYLRLTIQTNIPSFLKYNSAVNDDITYISNSQSKISDNQLKQMISFYLKKFKFLKPKHYE